MDSSIELEFADGKYKFFLPAPQIDELQTKCGIGIGGLFQRVYKGATINDSGKVVLLPHVAEFHYADIVETIRQGLIGGGKGVVNGSEVEVTPSLASRLINNYVIGKPLHPNWSIAAAILSACIVGYDPPKDEPAQEPATEIPTAA